MDDRGERRQLTLSAGGAAATEWHRLHPDEVSQRLGVDPAAGHSFDEAARRLALHGPNALTEAAGRSVARMIVDQFADVMILILLAAAVIAGVMGEAADTIAIVVIVLLNAIIGFVQEYRAEKAIAALRQMAAPLGAGAAPGRDPRAARARARPRRRRAARGRQRRAGRPAAGRCRAPARRGSRAHRRIAAGGKGDGGDRRPGPAPGRPPQHGVQGNRRDLRARPRASSSRPACAPSSAASRRCSRAPKS